MTVKQQREAVVKEVLALYQMLSSDIHNPGLQTIPIHLPYLGPIHGASMIIHCQKYEVSYSMYDVALRLEFPPPEVARLLGETEGEEGDDVSGAGEPGPADVDTPHEGEGEPGKGQGTGTGTGKKRKRKTE
jgi:hypothetical protein